MIFGYWRRKRRGYEQISSRSDIPSTSTASEWPWGDIATQRDLSAEVLRTFEKFRQGASKEYKFRISNWPEMNHVEAAILDRVARLYPEVFSRLEEFPVRHSGFLDSVIAVFDREVQFYLAYIEFKYRVEKVGLPFCYPVVATSKDIHAHDTFDLALANKLVEAHRPVVTNSFFLKDRERIFVVSGPNQGGKTTFARTVGQLHYLGCLGCPIPGTDAKLFFFDQLFTHFERQEDLQNLSGKLEDELKRIQKILEQATGRSILIMNESFLSTTLNDALFLSKKIMQRILSRGHALRDCHVPGRISNLERCHGQYGQHRGPDRPGAAHFQDRPQACRRTRVRCGNRSEIPSHSRCHWRAHFCK